MAKNKFNKKVKNLMSQINSSVSDKEGRLSEILEENLLKNLKNSDIKEYYEIKYIFNKLKEEIKNKIGNQTIAEKIKDIKLSSQDRFLTIDEERIRKNINLYMERQLLILSIFMKSYEKKIKLSEIEINFDKYVLSNFYRTFCEISSRLFTDVCLIVLNYEKISTLESKIKKLKKINNLLLKVKQDRILLNDLVNILNLFDHRLENKIDLESLIKKIFLYEKGEGFSLRNSVAHENMFLKEFDNNYLLDQIQRVNRFNMAFVIVFYFDTLEEVFSKKDLNLANQLFG